jgi:hypothetical protein
MVSCLKLLVLKSIRNLVLAGSKCMCGIANANANEHN